MYFYHTYLIPRDINKIAIEEKINGL
ncbi:hypothetical protein, partial [uncultured Gammaproteobacteria bacterium]